MSSRIDYSDLEGLVDEGRRHAAQVRARRGWPGRLLRRFLFWAVATVTLAVLPFLVLLRVSVGVYHQGTVGPWLSLTMGVAVTAALLWVYAWVSGRKVKAGPATGRLLRGGAVALVVAYAAYGMVYVAGSQAKTPEVRAEYTSLHPLLRMVTSIVFLADPASVMTDAARTPEDYALWGLPVNEASLHIRQENGYVHAVDLRTVGRGEWRNRLLELGFWIAGFHALRHRGTADHLHVSLRLPPG